MKANPIVSGIAGLVMGATAVMSSANAAGEMGTEEKTLQEWGAPNKIRDLSNSYSHHNFDNHKIKDGHDETRVDRFNHNGELWFTYRRGDIIYTAAIGVDADERIGDKNYLVQGFLDDDCDGLFKKITTEFDFYIPRCAEIIPEGYEVPDLSTSRYLGKGPSNILKNIPGKESLQTGYRDKDGNRFNTVTIENKKGEKKIWAYFFDAKNHPKHPFEWFIYDSNGDGKYDTKIWRKDKFETPAYIHTFLNR